MEFIVTGGFLYTVPILIFGMSSIILIVIASAKALSDKSVAGKITDAILFLGFFSLAWGIFGQILGMFQAAGSVARAGEISPSLIWAGLRVSMIPVIMGFVVLLISMVGWFALRSLRS